MLELQNRTQNCSLRFSGYQFPDSTDEYDSNWLNAEVGYSDERGTVSSAPLLTFEIKEALERIRSKRDWRSEFFEPEISMSIVSGIFELSLSYDLVEREPTIAPDIYRFRFDLNEDGVERQVIQFFENVLAEFPIRNR